MTTDDFESSFLSVIQTDDISLRTESQVKKQRLFQDISKLGVQIVENSVPGCGGMLWEAAAVLSNYLNHRYGTIDSMNSLQGKVILELGAGTGAVGLVLCDMYRKLGRVAEQPFSMILTDLSQILPITRENVLGNGFGTELDRGLISIEELEWGKPLSRPHIDLVLVSDCVYLEQCFEPLLDTFAQIIKTSGTRIIMSYKRRRRAEKKFFMKLRKLYQVAEITDYPGYEYYSRDRLFLFEITMKEM